MFSFPYITLTVSPRVYHVSRSRGTGPEVNILPATGKYITQIHGNALYHKIITVEMIIIMMIKIIIMMIKVVIIMIKIIMIIIIIIIMIIININI